MSGAVKLCGAGETRWARADDGDAFACTHRWRLSSNPTGLETSINNRLLDRFNRAGRIVDAEPATAFARRRADAPRELWKVIRLLKAFKRLAPVTAIDEVVPLRNQIIDGTPGG